MRVPVHQPLAAIDQTLVVELYERSQNRVVEFLLVHREAVARQVERIPQPPRLLEDRPARLLLPLPDLGDEGLAAHLAPAGVSRLRKLALDDHLRGDPGVVEARLPQHVVALHPMPAGQDVHQRVVERVAHVQRAGDVRRRQEDAERLAAWLPRSRPSRRRRRASQMAEIRASSVAASKVFSMVMAAAFGLSGARPPLIPAGRREEKPRSRVRTAGSASSEWEWRAARASAPQAPR